MRPEGCALITGGARGIGAACARGLAEDGWTVAVNSRSDHETAGDLCRQIRDAGGTAEVARGDLTDPEAVEAIFTGLEESHGAVLALVNNAGVRADALSPQITDEQWDLVIETNLSMAFRCTRRALTP